MSTRSIVAKPDGDAWKGRYVHSDGYPSGVGACLFTAYHEAFGGDLAAMTAKLVDSEHVGWSALCGHDLTLPPEWREYDAMPRTSYTNPAGETYDVVDYAAMGPRSYTARGETPQSDDPTGDWSTPDTPEEWFYVLSPGGLVVGEGATAVDLIPWSTPIPDALARLDKIEANR